MSVMSLHKLCFVTLLATIVAFTVAGRLNPYTKEFDVAKPGTPLARRALTHRVPHWADAVRSKRQMTSAVVIPIQSKNADDLGAGKLLVASRDMGDPSFAKTVILLVHYDDQAVVGLVLNRRTDIALSRVLDNFEGAKDRSDPAYLGGPVDVSTVFALLQSPAKVEGAEHIFGGVYLISTKPLFEKTLATRPDPKVFHVYLGYAGWTRDQLREEVKLGAWFIFPGDTGAVFNSDPDLLWSHMIGKTELKYAQGAPASADPWGPALVSSNSAVKFPVKAIVPTSNVTSKKRSIQSFPVRGTLG
jgi:putative transcriptional regulator